jgi:cellulose synthase/poly-beta-1,6-N-acetylglucosamine synthase-like glycosyltransferase
MEQIKMVYESLVEEKRSKGKTKLNNRAMAPQGTPQVSIVIPAYNAMDTIGRCLEALKNLQSGSPTHEIIVADNGSRDGTYEFLCNYPGIKVVRENYRGAGAARNAGLKEAQGEFVAFIDSDCIASPQWLIEGIPFFLDKGVAGVAGEIKGAEPKNAVQRWLNDRKMFDQRWTLAYKIPNIQAGNAIYRRSDLLKVGGFDPRMIVAEDTDISWRILKETQGRFAYAPNAIVTHVHHDNLKWVLWQAKKNAMTDAYMSLKWKKAFPRKHWKTSTLECLHILKYGGHYLYALALTPDKDQVENFKIEFLYRLARKTGMIMAALKLKQWNRW